MKNLFMILLVLGVFQINSNLFAQNDSTNTELKKKHEYYTSDNIEENNEKFRYPNYKTKDLDIYISPIALLEPFPTAYLGAEYFVKDKISLYLDLGYIFSFKKERRSDNTIALPYSSYANYVIKPEIRFYTKNNPQRASYHAIKFMFRNMNYKKEQIVYEDYSYDPNSGRWSSIGDGYQSDYRVRRRSIGIQYVKGWKGALGKRWINNFYFGIGMRYISNQPIKKYPTPVGDISGNWTIEFLDLKKQYKFVSMDISLGLRLGTELKKNQD